MNISCYLGGSEWADGQPEAYYHPEGRVIPGDTVRFQYKLTDHLGNTVVLFEDKNGDGQILTEQMSGDSALIEVLERHYYYPFGMAMEGVWSRRTAPGMGYLYNGKELNEDLGLNWSDYGARWYDAAIGRWNGVDPLAGMFPEWGPYHYAYDNPIKFFDLDGRIAVDDYYNEKGKFLYRDNKSTDNIKIIQSSKWKVISAIYSDQIADKSQTSLLLQETLNKNSFSVADDNAGLTLEAWSSIATDILLNGGFDVSNLHNEKVSVQDRITNMKFNDPVNSGTANTIKTSEGAIKITSFLYNGSVDPDYSTVSNLQNGLGAHEYDGHGQKGWGDKTGTHHKVYEYQMNHPTWEKTTPEFKKHIEESYKYYKDREK